MGRERGLALVGEMEEAEAVVVDEAGDWEATPGLAGRLELRHPPRGVG